MLTFKEWLAKNGKSLDEVGTGTNAVARFTMPIGVRDAPEAPPSPWSEDDDDKSKRKKKSKKS